MTKLLTETAERWEVDLRDRSVEMLTIDHQVTLHLRGDAGYDASVILESRFKISASGRDVIVLHPEEKAKLTPVLECFGKTVAVVSISRAEGALTVTCEFCGRDYRYDSVDVEQLFAADGPVQHSPARFN